MFESDTLKLILLYVIGGGGAGTIAYFFLSKWKKTEEFSSELKRYIAIGISGTIGILAFLASIGMNYEPAPVDARNWIEALVAIFFLSAGVSQVWHAATDLRARDRQS